MRTGRKIALTMLAMTLAAPVFAGRGPGPRDGRHGFHHRHHHHHGGHGHYIRRHGWHRPHSRVSLWFGYPAYSRIPSYSYYDYAYPNWDTRPNYVASGAVLGALAGAVIGNNSGDLGYSSWRGAALGSVVGLAAGAVAEKRAREREEEAAATAPTVTVSTQAPSAPEDEAKDERARMRSLEKPSRMAEANRLFGR